jgi:hypothetical protein
MYEYFVHCIYGKNMRVFEVNFVRNLKIADKNINQILYIRTSLKVQRTKDHKIKCVLNIFEITKRVTFRIKKNKRATSDDKRNDRIMDVYKIKGMKSENFSVHRSESFTAKTCGISSSESYFPRW